MSWCCASFQTKITRYGRILESLTKGRRERSRERIARILELLITARRPLKVHEIQGALSIRLEDSSVDFARRRLLTPSSQSCGSNPFSELCGPIIEVHADETASLVHLTAKQ